MSWLGPPTRTGRFALYRDPHPARVASFAEDVRSGLGTRPYTLLPKYFYDDLGSALFEAITHLPEYYLTRVERDLLATYGSQIVADIRRTARTGRTRQRQRDQNALDHRCDPRAPRFADVPSDRHLARRADRIVACARGRAREFARARLRRRLLRAAARASASAHRGRTLRSVFGSNVGNFEPLQARELFGLLGRDAPTRRRALDRLRS